MKEPARVAFTAGAVSLAAAVACLVHHIPAAFLVMTALGFLFLFVTVVLVRRGT